MPAFIECNVFQNSRLSGTFHHAKVAACTENDGKSHLNTKQLKDLTNRYFLLCIWDVYERFVLDIYLKAATVYAFLYKDARTSLAWMKSNWRVRWANWEHDTLQVFPNLKETYSLFLGRRLVTSMPGVWSNKCNGTRRRCCQRGTCQEC